MFSPALNLTEVFWKAEQSDGKILYKGPGQYDAIDRTKLEVFSLTYKNKPILQVRPGGRTLVWRMKTIGNLSLSKGTNTKTRVHIVALLAKPGNEMDQECEVDFHPNHPHQFYSHNMDESTIYYFFENGKHDARDKFGTMSPYRPVHLREDEFEHLMGCKDKSVIPIEPIEPETDEENDGW